MAVLTRICQRLDSAAGSYGKVCSKARNTSAVHHDLLSSVTSFRGDARLQSSVDYIEHARVELGRRSLVECRADEIVIMKSCFGKACSQRFIACPSMSLLQDERHGLTSRLIYIYKRLLSQMCQTGHGGGLPFCDCDGCTAGLLFLASAQQCGSARYLQ